MMPKRKREEMYETLKTRNMNAFSFRKNKSIKGYTNLIHVNITNMQSKASEHEFLFLLQVID